MHPHHPRENDTTRVGHCDIAPTKVCGGSGYLCRMGWNLGLHYGFSTYTQNFQLCLPHLGKIHEREITICTVIILTAQLQPGVTTDAIDRAVHEKMVQRGVYPSSLNYKYELDDRSAYADSIDGDGEFRYSLFPKAICTSINEVLCHGIPDDRPLKVQLG